MKTTPFQLIQTSGRSAVLAACVLALVVPTTSTVALAKAKSQSAAERSVATALESQSTRKKRSSTQASKRLKKRSKRLLAQNDSDEDFEDLDDLDSELDAEDPVDSAAAETGSNEDLKLDSEESQSPVANQANEEKSFVGEEVRIVDLKYDSATAGGTIAIKTSGQPTYRVRENADRNQVVIEIANAVLPEKLKRPFNTKDFKQNIIGFNAYQDSGSNTARVVIQFKEPKSVNVVGQGDTLLVATQGASAAGGGTSRLASNSSGDLSAQVRDANAMDDREARGQSYEVFEGRRRSEYAPSQVQSLSSNRANSSSAGMALPSSSIEEERSGGPDFVGKPISIEVRDTPVREVIGIIAEQSGANIILSDGITANMTIKLRQIPWDQALSIIMKAQGLGYVRQGHVLRIAPLARLQQEANEAQAILIAQEAMMPLRVRVIPVSFADVSALSTQIRNTIQAVNMQPGPNGLMQPMATGPNQMRGRIEPDQRSSSLVVTDTEDNIKKIESLVRALDVPPLQVMIEGKIVEAREELGQAFGIDWGYSGQDLGFAGGTLSQNATFKPAETPVNTTLNLRLGTLDFLGDLTARLTLLERDSKAKVISSPRVVTINNQEAEITQTVSIPIQTVVANNLAPVTTVAFQPIPTTLKVRPQITPGGDVLMNIFFERQFQSASAAGAAGAGGGQAPIDIRKVQTNVMVKNGQTTVIGGIYQSDQNEEENKTPFLGNVPVLGWLFKSRRSSQIRNELLVFLTPRILNQDHNLPKSEKNQ